VTSDSSQCVAMHFGYFERSSNALEVGARVVFQDGAIDLKPLVCALARDAHGPNGRRTGKKFRADVCHRTSNITSQNDNTLASTAAERPPGFRCSSCSKSNLHTVAPWVDGAIDNVLEIHRSTYVALHPHRPIAPEPPRSRRKWGTGSL
jgi:hypothetical protein